MSEMLLSSYAVRLVEVDSRQYQARHCIHTNNNIYLIIVLLLL